ncbi:unnamed protein product [Linum trigynum]|uniref:Uncharacterized protein n=1 Tax=Linum trigynum TaxID=586398 RepID=A0AAV2CRC8_9ROSI
MAASSSSYCNSNQCSHCAHLLHIQHQHQRCLRSTMAAQISNLHQSKARSIVISPVPAAWLFPTPSRNPSPSSSVSLFGRHQEDLVSSVPLSHPPFFSGFFSCVHLPITPAIKSR